MEMKKAGIKNPAFFALIMGRREKHEEPSG